MTTEQILDYSDLETEDILSQTSFFTLMINFFSKYAYLEINRKNYDYLPRGLKLYLI